MVTISKENGLITLMNVFTVDREKQQSLIELLVKTTEEVMRYQPGFVSANIHRSLDGTRVVNYAQWRSRDEFEAMLRNPKARPHMEEVASLVQKFEPYLHEVVSVHSV
ncbi:MAG: antibiotic biosynthesis monooxygenase family protein [Terriglobia bacterium]